jgi:hypothetical protein
MLKVRYTNEEVLELSRRYLGLIGGQPMSLACAAGIAAINVTLEEDLPSQAAVKGEFLPAPATRGGLSIARTSAAEV